jgi:hypothetical protein
MKKEFGVNPIGAGIAIVGFIVYLAIQQPIVSSAIIVLGLLVIFESDSRAYKREEGRTKAAIQDDARHEDDAAA